MTCEELMTTCPKCGCEIERRLPDGWEGEIESIPAWIREMPLWCSACHERQESEEAAAEVARNRARIERESDIPAVLRERGAGVRLAPQLDSLASKWAVGAVPHVVLAGPVGVGKTTVAAVAAMRRVAMAKPLRWTTAPYLLSRLGSGLGTSDHDKALHVLTGHVALVLDDLDKVRPTEYGAEQVFNAIDRRLTAGIPLLVTSNLTPAELAGRYPEPYGSAIASRLGGECRVVQMQGSDRRFQPRATEVAAA